MRKKITVVDCGAANLLNVKRAFEHCGAEVLITNNPLDFVKADRLVIPGVGAFKDYMSVIISSGYKSTLFEFFLKNRPFLGICIGMQILFDSSEEFGISEGLGIIPGHVKAIPPLTVDGELLRVPHIGWSALCPSIGHHSWMNTVFEEFGEDALSFYFVHSFFAEPDCLSDRLADCIYGGHRICAAIQRDNILATQFHPEKSGKAGLALIQQFINM